MISTSEEFKVFEKLTEGFGFGKLQDALTVKTVLEEHNYTMDDVESYVQWKKELVKEQMKEQIEEFEQKIKPARDALMKVVPECPECNSKLYLSPIKEPEGQWNKHGYKSVWQCNGETCLYEKYNTVDGAEIITNLVGEEHAKNLGYNG